MNNKGQSLALFIILIPVIIMMGVYVIDIGYMKYNKNKLNGITEEAVSYSLDHFDGLDKEKVKNMIMLNDDEIKSVSITDIENGVLIETNKSFKGLFGYFIDNDLYDAKSVYKGTLIDGTKNIERVE